ncbi:MAG: DUF429 domain-containing protein, partial [Chloroflexota bacterium]|nr:DUF429 domain-containing protein [Chloroflexota bacterium]
MTPALQDRAFEVHPEVSFWALAGERPMAHHKGKLEGYEERRELLAMELDGVDIPTRLEAHQIARPAKADDVLDTIVAAWTARRFAMREAGRLPKDPETDACGLRMEIVY